MSGFQFSYLFNWDLVVQSFPFVISGAKYTLVISAASILLGLCAGLMVALARMAESKWIRSLARTYISFMRGTPLLVLLFILYYGLPMVNIQLPALAAAIIGMSANAAAYDAEVIRAAILAVPKEQWEAARSLGLSRGRVLWVIILPQAARVALPPLTNIFLDIVKGSSLAAVITVPELLYDAQVVAGATYESLTMYILIALIYWMICALIAALQSHLEQRFSKHIQG